MLRPTAKTFAAPMTSLATGTGGGGGDPPGWLLKLKDPQESPLPICAHIEHCLDDLNPGRVRDSDFVLDEHLLDATKQLLARTLAEPGSPDILVGTLKAIVGRVSERLLRGDAGEKRLRAWGEAQEKNAEAAGNAGAGALEAGTVDQFYELVESLTSLTSVFNMKYGKDKPAQKEEDGEGGAGEGDSESDADTDEDDDFVFDPEWRAKIDFADWVDFLDDKGQKWSRAQIIETNPGEFKYKIQKEGTSAYLAEWVEIFSDRIAQDGLHTRKQKLALKKFQKKLNIGDRVDAQTTLKYWRAGRIVDTVDADHVDLQCDEVGTRFGEGEGKDQSISKCLIRFDGFTEISDEWVERYGTRLEPLHTHTAEPVCNRTTYSWDNNTVTSSTGGTALLEDASPGAEKASLSVDDAGDPADVHFLHRPDESTSLSPRVCEVLNHFAEAGGFEALCHRSSLDGCWIRVERLSMILANVGTSASRSFVDESFMKIVKALTSGMEQLPTTALRNMSFPKVDQLMTRLSRHVLHRIFHSNKDAHEFKETFTLSFAASWLKSDLLPRRLDGLNRLIELAQSTRTYSLARSVFLTSEYIITMIREEELLHELLKPGQHNQVMKRSAEVFKWLSSQSNFSVQDLKLLWQAAALNGQDVDTRKLIYNIILELKLQYDEPHYLFIAGAFAAETEQTITRQKLSTIAEIGDRAPIKSHSASLDIGKTLLKFCMVMPPVDGAIDAFMHFIESVWVKNQRSEYCLTLFQNLLEQKCVKPTLRLFPQLLRSFPEKKFYATEDKVTQKSIVESLESGGKSIIDIVLSLDKTKYLQEVLAFLSIFLPISSHKLTPERINTLWTGEHHDALCEWVVSPDVKQILDIDTETYIIKNLVCQDETIEDISVLEFKCLKELIYRINESHRRLIRHYNGADQITFLFGIDLTGIDAIWNCAVYAKDRAVGDMAIDLLISFISESTWDSPISNSCFLSPADIKKLDNVYVDEDGEPFQDPWRVFVSKCCAYLSQPDVIEKPECIYRCIELLNGVLNQSEMQGVKGLRAHIHRSRGRKLKVCVKYKEMAFYAVAYANDTLWELKSAIADHLNRYAAKTVDASDIELKLERKESSKCVLFSQNDNPKTLSQNKFRRRENITVTSGLGDLAAPGEQAPKAEILRQDKSHIAFLSFSDDKLPTNRFESAVKSIFRQHCNAEGTMATNDIIAYFSYCGANDSASISQNRILDIIEKYDNVEKSALTETGFVEFYSFQAHAYTDAVWKDLKTHGYLNSLVRPVPWVSLSSVENKAGDSGGKDERASPMPHAPIILPKRKCSDLPRFWLVHNKEFCSKIFELLNHSDDGVASHAWALVMRLPTNPILFRDISDLQDGEKSPRWDVLLSQSSTYSLIYNLQIIEYLVDPVDVDNEAEDSPKDPSSPPPSPERKPRETVSLTDTTQNAERHLTNASAWKKRFLNQGGFRHLYSIFLGKTSRGDIGNGLDNLVTGLLLKLVRTFMLAAMSSQGNNFHEIAELVRQRSCHNKPLAVETKVNGLIRLRSESEAAHDSLETMLGQSISGVNSLATSMNLQQSISPSVSALLTDLGTTPPPGTEFLTLVRQLSDGGSATLGDSLLRRVDFSAIQTRLFNIIKAADMHLSGRNSPKKSDGVKSHINKQNIARRVMQRAIGLWVACAMYDGTMFETFSRSSDLFDVFVTCLKSPVLEVRREIAHAARVLSCAGRQGTCEESAAIILLRKLLGHLCKGSILKPFGAIQYRYDFFYDLIAALLTDVFRIKNQVFNPSWSLDVLAKTLSSRIMSADVGQEAREVVHATGAMRILKTMLARENELGDFGVRQVCRNGLAGYVLQNYVFCQRAPAKSQVYRMALALLKVLCLNTGNTQSNVGEGECEEDDSLMFGAEELGEGVNSPALRNWYGDERDGLLGLVSALDDLHVSVQGTPSKTLEMAIGNETRVNSHVGLRNLGSTCYLNSVFQQLYAIEEFRRGLLTTGFDGDSVSSTFQSIFWKMYLTQRPYVETAEFCKVFKFNDGDDLQVNQQQDATEFFTRLMDIVEEDIKTASVQNFIKRTFVGSAKTRMTCNDCGRTIDKEQEVNCLQMEVKNRANMMESLDAYTSSEALSGYKCESCGKRDSTEKRCLLGDLPPVLFFSLKRFELNYETFLREKVNTRYAFPNELDLEKYMHETHWPSDSAERTGTKYRLSGIIIHSGQATTGHYYAFIRQDDGTWQECNDLKVVPWDSQSRMEADCFGGAAKSFSSAYSFYSQKPSTTSAYMLIYRKNEIKEVNAEETLGLASFVPKPLGESIRADNGIIEKLRKVYDPSYLNFLSDLIVHIGETELNLCKANVNYAKQQQVDQGVELYCFVLRAVLYVFRNAKDSSRFEEVSSVLRKLFGQNLLRRRESSIVMG